ncbi:hypothetical protein M885DRAFT_557100 [Pelagophyceae sp. CCMP2097]|nr:hypothetical protein M885DRAFT_557100 [Pelagophyceae sp. CCMP2097]
MITAGWIMRKVKQNDKWVRRWLEVNRHVLYSYQARVINMLDLRKTREISLVDGGKDGLFAIIPMSADEAHAGYLMRAESQAAAVEWVAGLNKVRAAELEKVPLDPDARSSSDGGLCCCFSRRRQPERTPLMLDSTTA